MKEIKITKNQLLGTLTRLRRAFSAKSALPILCDYVFELDGNKMTVSVCNGDDVWMSESFMLPDENITTEGETRRGWCVNRYYIVPGLRSLEDQDITLRIQDYQMSVIHSYGKFCMPIEDINEYPMSFRPSFRDNIKLSSMKIEAPGMRHWLEIQRDSLATDELRPVMNGICFKLQPEGLEMCASDGHKLVRIRKNSLSGVDNTIIIPKKAIGVLSDVLPKTGEVDFTFTGGVYHEEKKVSHGYAYTDIVFDQKAVGRIDIEIDSDTDHFLHLWFTGIDGRYPDYNRVIPENHPYCISVDRRLMIKCLERASVFCNTSSKMVKFDIGNDRISFISENADFETSSEESIPCESRSEEFDGQIFGFQVTSVSSLVKRLATKSILIRFSDPSSAIIIEPEPQPEVENVTMLLMPMFIGG